MIIGPQKQKEQSKIIDNIIKRYKVLYVSVILFSVLMVVLFFIGSKKINYIQENYYVYGENKFKLNPDIIEEEISILKLVVVDSIVPIVADTVTPPPPSRRTLILPKSHDLRRNFSSIKNQGSQGSCLAFTLSSIMEYMIKSKKLKAVDLSEAFLYYESRKKAGDQDIDIGSNFLYSLQSLAENGICSEQYMPYSEYDYTTSPSRTAYTDALANKISMASSVNLEIEDLKKVLYNGYPIAISINMYPSFGNGENFVIPFPSKRELSRNNGMHSMVIVGYNEDKQQFIVRNSWGEDFGDHGYCYIPYDYITDESLTNCAYIINGLKKEK